MTDSTIRRGKETKKISKAKQTMNYKHYRENWRLSNTNHTTQSMMNSYAPEGLTVPAPLTEECLKHLRYTNVVLRLTNSSSCSYAFFLYNCIDQGSYKDQIILQIPKSLCIKWYNINQSWFMFSAEKVFYYVQNGDYLLWDDNFREGSPLCNTLGYKSGYVCEKIIV